MRRPSTAQRSLLKTESRVFRFQKTLDRESRNPAPEDRSFRAARDAEPANVDRMRRIECI
jgi:hypothetical protein